MEIEIQLLILSDNWMRTWRTLFRSVFSLQTPCPGHQRPMTSAAITTESPLVALSRNSLPTESVTPNEMVIGTPAIGQSPPTASRQTPSSRPPSRVTEIFSSKAIKREKGSTGVDLGDMEAEAKYRWRIPRSF